MEDFPGHFRSLFPIANRYVYLNHASVSPLARPTRDGMAAALDGIMKHGSQISADLECVHASTRANAARLVNAKPYQIAFLRNTSEALSIIANGIEWRQGDNVVTTSVEFPANLYPWLRIAATQDLEIRLQAERHERIDTGALLTLVDDRTRVVTVSWVQFASGQRLDIRRIGQFCRDREILFVVDAVQGLGALQLDVEQDCIDAFAAGAHKFLLGPKGVSLLYLSDRALEQVQPTVIGWTAVKGYEDHLCHDLDFRDGAIRFEGGTLNTVGICGLGEAIDLFLEADPSRIENYLLSLNGYIRNRLAECGYTIVSPRCAEESSAIVVCRPLDFSAEEVCTHLEERNIIVCARRGGLRIAPHFYNTKADVDALIDALPG